jgi:hypothetical protein
METDQEQLKAHQVKMAWLIKEDPTSVDKKPEVAQIDLLP